MILKYFTEKCYYLRENINLKIENTPQILIKRCFFLLFQPLTEWRICHESSKAEESVSDISATKWHVLMVRHKSMILTVLESENTIVLFAFKCLPLMFPYVWNCSIKQYLQFKNVDQSLPIFPFFFVHETKKKWSYNNLYNTFL